MFIRPSSYPYEGPRLEIMKFDDDWWLVCQSENHFYHKCDTIDGLFEFINDKCKPKWEKTLIKKFKNWALNKNI